VCGIAGIITRNPVGKASLERMLATMHHRGPDDQGTFNVQRSTFNVALGMRRLSIIDVASGDQPIYNEDDTLAIICNGEIYNYRELTSELKSRGHRFATRSDTEAIVHAYEEWGADCVHRLRGMFAFAIYDQRSTFNVQCSTLFLARDRLGIKPLYYYHHDGLCLFASEVRALLASGLVPRRLSLDGVASYLAYGSVQEPLTLIEGVYSLPPGQGMTINVQRSTFDVQRLTCHVQRYWDFPTPEDGRWQLGEGRRNQKEIIAELRDLLAESVRLRLISEVPLGAFLSSGIDSSAVVALMSQVSDAPVKAFTIGFAEQEFSEAELAQAMARRCGAEHHEIIVRPQQVLADLPQALAAMDQPSIDGINTYYVSQATKQAGITVALSGLGGDELFAGYPTFQSGPRLMTLSRYLPTLPPSFVLRPSSLFQNDRWRKFIAFLSGDAYFAHPYYTLRALFIPGQRAQLLNREVMASLNDHNPWRDAVQAHIGHAIRYDPINAISYLECTNYLPSTLLRDTDCMSMAHSLEVRVPLIDHKLVEFMMQLPGNLKIRNPQSAIRNPTSKHLLVQALGGELLPEVVHQKKRTFTFPWNRWLRHELRHEIEDALATPASALQGILEPTAINAVWKQFLAGRVSWSRVWALYVLQKWVDQHLG